MLTDRPLKTSRASRVPLVAGLFPFMLVLITIIAMTVTGNWTTDLVLPLLAMSAFSVIIIALSGLFTWLLIRQEIHTIRHILNDTWAHWPQYSTEQQWRSKVEKDWQSDQKTYAFSWLQFIVVGLIFVGITVFTAAISEGESYVMLTVILVLALMLTGITLSPVVQRRTRYADYQRRIALPPPEVSIGRWGVYSDDEGLTSLRTLEDVRFVPADEVRQERKALKQNAYAGDVEVDFSDPLDLRLADSGWGQVYFSIRYRTRYRYRRSVYTVRVPPGHEAEAQSLVERFRAE